MVQERERSVIRIVLADDHRVLRDGLRSLINQESDMEVVAEAENGRRVVEAVVKAAPDVVVMDVSMPDLNGIEATRQVLELAPGTRILALSMHSDKRLVASTLSAGASGYLLKECAFDEIARAIRTVAANRTYLSPGVTDIVVGDYVQRMTAKEEASTFTVLSPREREVLQLVAEGHATKEIAAKLFISVKTVETHRQKLMDKLDLHSVPELTKYAIREGLTSLE
ncbi:MAG: response regulator transcription factor [Armatimonadota bacterium]